MPPNSPRRSKTWVPTALARDGIGTTCRWTRVWATHWKRGRPLAPGSPTEPAKSPLGTGHANRAQALSVSVMLARLRLTARPDGSVPRESFPYSFKRLGPRAPGFALRAPQPRMVRPSSRVPTQEDPCPRCTRAGPGSSEGHGDDQHAHPDCGCQAECTPGREGPREPGKRWPAQHHPEHTSCQ